MSRTRNSKQRGFRDLKHGGLYKKSFHLICVDDVYHIRKKDREKNRVLRARLKVRDKKEIGRYVN